MLQYHTMNLYKGCLLDKVRNVDIRHRLKITKTISEEIVQRRPKWFGHVARMPQQRLPLRAYKNDFTTRRPRGRPPMRWRDQVQDDVGMPLKDAEHQNGGG